MARLPRMSVPGLPHLVVQSGHNDQPVILDAEDRRHYRDALSQAARDCCVAVHAYALGERRILLLATPHGEGALSRMLQRVGRRYTAGFNRRHGRRGTLWEGRFRAGVVDPQDWLLAAMRHVETDPSRRSHEPDPPGCPRSSAAHHLGVQPDPLVTDHPAFWQLGNTPFEREAAYGLLLSQPLDPSVCERLEHAMSRGWAIGSERFLAELAGQLSRPVRPRAPGRPPRPGNLPAAA